jgi:DNA-directed RNA polymerase subunit M/transcription elongation factor TFIIS
MHIKRWAVITIERSLYNATIDGAKEKNIPTFWGSSDFVAQYSSLGYTLKINLDIKSSVNGTKCGDDHQTSLVAMKVCNAIKLKYFCHLQNLSDVVKKLITSYVSALDLDRIAYLSSLELNPAINQKFVAHLNLRNQQHVEEKCSEMHLCACGQRKTRVYSKQIRSFDEGPTIFIECIKCGRKWT